MLDYSLIFLCIILYEDGITLEQIQYYGVLRENSVLLIPRTLTISLNSLPVACLIMESQQD
jgi:hypothetical protein